MKGDTDEFRFFCRIPFDFTCHKPDWCKRYMLVECFEYMEYEFMVVVNPTTFEYQNLIKGYYYGNS